MLNVTRGLLASVVGALGAIGLVVVLTAGFLVCRWVFTGTSEFDRGYDLRQARERLVIPLIGCSAVFACSAWATFAPTGRFRFVGTLAVVSLASLLLWPVLGSIFPAPQRLKGVEHPTLDPSDALILMGAPVVAAGLLTAWRLRRAADGGPRKAKEDVDRWDSEIA